MGLPKKVWRGVFRKNPSASHPVRGGSPLKFPIAFFFIDLAIWNTIGKSDKKINYAVGIIVESDKLVALLLTFGNKGALELMPGRYSLRHFQKRGTCGASFSTDK
jgi:hypothetical protein